MDNRKRDHNGSEASYMPAAVNNDVSSQTPQAQYGTTIMQAPRGYHVYQHAECPTVNNFYGSVQSYYNNNQNQYGIRNLNHYGPQTQSSYLSYQQYEEPPAAGFAQVSNAFPHQTFMPAPPPTLPPYALPPHMPIPPKIFHHDIPANSAPTMQIGLNGTRELHLANSAQIAHEAYRVGGARHATGRTAQKRNANRAYGTASRPKTLPINIRDNVQRVSDLERYLDPSRNPQPMSIKAQILVRYWSPLGGRYKFPNRERPNFRSWLTETREEFIEVITMAKTEDPVSFPDDDHVFDFLEACVKDQSFSSAMMRFVKFPSDTIAINRAIGEEDAADNGHESPQDDLPYADFQEPVMRRVVRGLEVIVYRYIRKTNPTGLAVAGISNEDCFELNKDNWKLFFKTLIHNPVFQTRRIQQLENSSINLRNITAHYTRHTPETMTDFLGFAREFLRSFRELLDEPAEESWHEKCIASLCADLETWEEESLEQKRKSYEDLMSQFEFIDLTNDATTPHSGKIAIENLKADVTRRTYEGRVLYRKLKSRAFAQHILDCFDGKASGPFVWKGVGAPSISPNHEGEGIMGFGEEEGDKEGSVEGGDGEEGENQVLSGSPPKGKGSSPDHTKSPVDNEIPDEGSPIPNPEPAKRRRGRPRKLPVTEPAAPIAKRPVGRPRKTPLPEPGAKRPVGRPRKLKVALVTEDDNTCSMDMEIDKEDEDEYEEDMHTRPAKRQRKN